MLDLLLVVAITVAVAVDADEIELMSDIADSPLASLNLGKKGM